MSLTERQRKFVKSIVGMVARREKIHSAVAMKKAAMDAGYSEGGAKAAAYENLKNEEVISHLLEKIVDTGKINLTARKNTLGEKLTEEWVIKLLRNQAVNAKSDATKVKALEILGKWHKLGMWTERVETIDVPHDRERLLERIKELNKQHGIATIGSPAGDVSRDGDAGTAGAKEPAGRREADSDTEGFSIGQLNDQAVQRGKRRGQDGDSGDGHSSPNAERTSPAKDGEDVKASDICEGDVSVAN
jgi:phage terminase small subunit